MKRTFAGSIGWIMLSLSLCACATQPTPAPTVQHFTPTASLLSASVTPSASASPTPLPTSTATRFPAADRATPTPTLIPTPLAFTPSADSSAPLNTTGPWFAYRAWTEGSENLYGKAFLVNPDGSGRRQLDSNVWAIVANAAGPYLAVLTQPPELQGGINIGASILEIIHLPDMRVKTILLLSSPMIATFDYSQLKTLYGLDRQHAIATITWAVSYKRPAWSPDGRYLAFTAAIDGPTADLYVYDTLNDQIHRLTDGLEMATQPEWSPDGKWIVHRGLWGFGAGCTESGVWAAAVDGSQVKWLGPGNCIEITRWTGPETFEAYTPPPGPASVSNIGPVVRVDIAAGTSTFLYMTSGDPYPPLVDCLTQKSIATPGLLDNSTRIDSPDKKWFAVTQGGLRIFAADGSLVAEFGKLDQFAGWQPGSNAAVFTTLGKPDQFTPLGNADRRTLNYFLPLDRSLKTFVDALPAASPHPDSVIFSSHLPGFFLLSASSQELDFLDPLKGQFLRVDGPIGDIWNIADSDFTWVGEPKPDNNSGILSCYMARP